MTINTFTMYGYNLITVSINNKASLSYSKCPKISYTKVPNKMAYANIADVDQNQTAPVWSGSSFF